MSVRIRPILCLATALSVAACEESPLPPQDGEFSAILVYGAVRDPSGAAVSGAGVSVWESRSSGCTTGSPAVPATTDASGSFRAIPGNWGMAYDACIVVQVQPPAGSGLSAETVTRHPVRLSTELDSVRIDVVLAP